MKMKLPQNYKLIEHNSIDSTNLEARRLIQSGEIGAGATVITAKSQTGGRGRLDRKWVSAEGNLFVSVVSNQWLVGSGQEEKNRYSPLPITLYPFLTALAIGDTLKEIIDTKPLYKWPNDVLVAGEKISGVLIEMISGYVIIGVGINIANYPLDGTKIPATCVNNHTETPAKINKILEKFIHNLDKKLSMDMAAVIEEWTASAYGIGKKIVIEQEKNQIFGIFRGVDANGWLILETEGSKRELVSFGDVSWI